MDDQLYDEFGNYIGPELDDDEEIEEEEWMNERARDEEEEDIRMDNEDEEETSVQSRSIVLHEDKKYYPSASEVYGNVETLVEDEDTQPLSEPIIAPIKKKKFVVEDTIPAYSFSKQFLEDTMTIPERIRNIAFVGSLHHGKTIFMDMLIQQTHEKKWNISKNVFFLTLFFSLLLIFH